MPTLVVPYFKDMDALLEWGKKHDPAALRKYVFFKTGGKEGNTYACWRQKKAVGNEDKPGWVPELLLPHMYSDIDPLLLLEQAAGLSPASSACPLLDVRFKTSMGAKGVDPPHGSDTGTLQSAIKNQDRACGMMTLEAQRKDHRARQAKESAKGGAALSSEEHVHPCYDKVVFHRLVSTRMSGASHGGPSADERIQVMVREVLESMDIEGGRQSSERAVLRTLCEVLFDREPVKIKEEHLILRGGQHDMLLVNWNRLADAPLNYLNFKGSQEEKVWRQAREKSGSRHAFKAEHLRRILRSVGGKGCARNEDLYKALNEGTVSSQAYKDHVALIWTFLDYVFPSTV